MSDSEARNVAPGAWSLDGWAAFWRQPTIEMVRARIPTVCATDITGYWPRQRPLHGIADYTQRLVDLLTFVPDARLVLAEHAVNGNVVFARWAGTGTGPDGPFEIVGCDRFILRDGRVVENRILSDGDIFEHFARHVGAHRARPSEARIGSGQAT